MNRKSLSDEAKAVLLPWEFSDELLEEIGLYEHTHRYTAVFWEWAVIGAMLFTGYSFRKASHDASLQILGVFARLWEMGWLDENSVDPGVISLKPTHWLIFDRKTRLAWAAPLDLARGCVEQQEIPGWDG